MPATQLLERRVGAPRPPRQGPLLLLCAGVLWLGALSGCDCPDGAAVYPIREADYASLRQRYGDDALPDYECDRLCLDREPDPADCAAGAAGSGSSIGQGAALPCDTRTPYVSVGECSLARIYGVDPAVACRGYRPCH